MTRKRKLVLVVGGTVVLIACGLIVYLAVSDLSGWRDTVARTASRAMNRELRIAGEFEVDLGRVTRVHATDLSLANAEWGSEPTMASIGRLDAEIDIVALFNGSILLPSIDIEGGRALFESHPKKGSNWLFIEGGEESEDPVRLRIDSIRAGDVTLSFRSRSSRQDWEVAVADLDSEGDEFGMHDLAGTGSLRGSEFEVHGSLGTLEALVNLDAVDHDLELELGSSHLSSAGSIAELATLTGFDLQTTATIPEPLEITELLGLPESNLGSLSLELRTRSTSGLTGFDAEIAGPAADLRLDGTIDSLIAPTDVDLNLLFEGSDIRPVAQLVGAEGLNGHPFSAAGNIRWRGFPLEVNELEIRVGENLITADGHLGEPPLMLGTDFRFQGAGPNIAAVAVLTGRDVPPDAFEIEGHLARTESGLDIDDIRIAVGRTTLSAGGFVGDPPTYADTQLEFDLSGDNLARLTTVVGRNLPHRPFRASGLLAEGDGAMLLQDVSATLGRGNIELDGRLTTETGLIGTDLSFSTKGLNLLDVGGFLGSESFPDAEFRAAGRLSVSADGYRIRNVNGGIAGMNLEADGLITRVDGLDGTRLEIVVAGDDASIFDDSAAPLLLPRERFRVDGTLHIRHDGAHLEGVEFELAEATGTVDASIGSTTDGPGVDATLSSRGPSLATFDRAVSGITLPDEPFSVSGAMKYVDGGLYFEETTIDLAGNRVEIDGLIDLSHDLEGSVIETSIEIPDLSSLGEMIESSSDITITELPAVPVSLASSFSVDEGVLGFPDLTASLGSAAISASGTVGRPPEFIGSDFEIEIDGPDASLINTFLGFDFAVKPFSLTGRIGRDDVGIFFHHVEVSLADYRASIDGRLGPLPKLIGTSLTVDAKGPDLKPLKRITGIKKLPSAPWSLAGHFDGNPSRFKGDWLAIRLGSSDVSGNFNVDLREKPRLVARLRSNHLSFTDLVPAPETADPSPPAETSEPAPSVNEEDPSPYLIPDTPWDLSVLDRFDADFDWQFGKIHYFVSSDRDVELSVVLDDGRLEIDRFQSTGTMHGTVSGAAALTPVATGHHLVTEFHVDDGMINLAGEGADPSQYTPVDLHVDLDLTGRTVHEMMAGSDGLVTLTVDNGVLKQGIIHFITADFLVTILNTLNPFAKQDEFTNLNCAVIALNFDDGVMVMDPAAVQTDKVTVLGNGTIDFSTENLRFDWVTKPRKGIGLSASMFTNPYIRLGGTLSDPHVEMKPAEAVATTGVAVAPMGISLMAKRLWDRITAEKKVCQKAQKQIDKQTASKK